MEFRINFGPREGPTARGAAQGVRTLVAGFMPGVVVVEEEKIRWRGVSGAWPLSGAPLPVSLSCVHLCACLSSDGGLISDEGKELTFIARDSGWLPRN